MKPTAEATTENQKSFASSSFEVSWKDVSFTPQESYLKDAWKNKDARERIVRVLEKGILSHAPQIAKKVLSKIAELSLQNLDNENTVLELRKCFLADGSESLKNRSFALDEDLRVVKRALQLNQLTKNVPETFLDIGCGNGRIAAILASNWQIKSDNCIAVDVYKRTEESLGFTYRQVVAGRLPLNDNSIDFSTMLMTLHHEANPQQLMAEAFRVLRPGGTLIIRDHNAENISDRLFFRALDMIYLSLFSDLKEVPQPANYQSAVDWHDLAHDTGFKIEKCFNPEPDSPIKPFHMLLRKPEAHE